MVASWSRGTGVAANTGSVVDAPDEVVQTTPHTSAYRFGLVNQLWLSQKRNAFHVDLTVGVVRSSVLTYTGWYNGTHLEVAAGWGGWGGFFVSGDFLDGDSRVITGFRAHAIPALPAIGLVLLGLLAGGRCNEPRSSSLPLFSWAMSLALAQAAGADADQRAAAGADAVVDDDHHDDDFDRDGDHAGRDDDLDLRDAAGADAEVGRAAGVGSSATGAIPAAPPEPPVPVPVAETPGTAGG